MYFKNVRMLSGEVKMQFQFQLIYNVKYFIK